jgi:O-antigen/teichoic acid export membrane protein
MALKNRILSNGLASILQKLIRVVEQLFLVPFFITAWGAAYYGEWLTLTIIPSVMAFSNLGFGSAAGNSFVLTYASGDQQKAASISKTGFYIITIMILIAILISALTIVVLDYFNVFEKSLIEKSDAIIAVSFMIIAQLLMFYLQLMEAYYRAAQKAALSINLITLKSTFLIGTGLLVLVLGYGVIEFAITQFIVTLTFIVLYGLKGRKVLGLFKTHNGIKDKVILKDITSKGLSYLMLPVWQIIYFQGSTFVVRIVLGPEAVAVFNTVRTLSRSFNKFLYFVDPTIFPELQYYIGKNQWETAKKIFRISILGVFLMSIIGCILLAIFGPWFYAIWTKNELDLPKAMWYVSISGLIFNALWYSAEMVFRAVNQPKKMGIFGVISAIISVAFTYVFAQHLGLVGAALGALTLDILLVILILPLGCKLMHMSLGELFKHGFADFNTLNQQLISKLKSLKN